MKMSTFKKASPTISVSKPSNESEAETEKMTSNLFFCLSINARSVLYRRIYLLQMICFPFIPILALFVQNLSIFIQQIYTYDESRHIYQQVSIGFPQTLSEVNFNFYQLYFNILLPFLFFVLFSSLQISLTVNVSKLLTAIQQERSASIFYLLTNENRQVSLETIFPLMCRQEVPGVPREISKKAEKLFLI